ncbi:MAG: hypothetical protein U0519_03565 [Candidatus Gracilibacteria bacterium]
MKKFFGYFSAVSIGLSVVAGSAFAQDLKFNQLKRTELLLNPAVFQTTSEVDNSGATGTAAGTDTTTENGQTDATSSINCSIVLSPSVQSFIEMSVKKGNLPGPEAMKNFPPAVQQCIIAEIEKQLKAKNWTGENEKGKGGFLQNIFSEYWLQLLGFLVSVIGVMLAVSGFSLANSKKKKHISKYMNEIDDAFHSFKWKSKRCEAELYRLHDIIEDKLKQGKLDESSYQLLTGRIDKYIKEVQDVDGIPNDKKHTEE